MAEPAPRRQEGGGLACLISRRRSRLMIFANCSGRSHGLRLIDCFWKRPTGYDPGRTLISTHKIPSTNMRNIARESLPSQPDPRPILSRLLELKAGRTMHAIVERQGGRPGQGISSTFTSATAFGSLLATLQIVGCSIELVTAAVWKVAAGLGRDKQASLDRARLLFPAGELDRKKDHGRAEALLIAQFALQRRTA
jgi:hypothetical protein